VFPMFSVGVTGDMATEGILSKLKSERKGVVCITINYY
jgi:hypothetical protein